MNETLNYIDNYFNGHLTTVEKGEFESKCEADPAFAEEVAMFISLRDGLKRQLYEQKKKEFDDIYRESLNTDRGSIGIFRQFIPYLAAACLVLVVALVFLLKQDLPESLASNYIDKNLKTLSATMGNADSLQVGIAAYNAKNYNEAERIFKFLLTNESVSDKALAYLGVVYMVTERYTELLIQFDNLSKRTNLFANPGLFYKALVLLKRSEGDDRVTAKKILQEVIAKDLPGRREAETWIKDL